MNRKTVRRYVEAAKVAGVVQGGDEEQLDEALIGSAVEGVRPHRSDGPGETWHLLVANRDQIMRCTRCPPT